MILNTESSGTHAIFGPNRRNTETPRPVGTSEGPDASRRDALKHRNASRGSKGLCKVDLLHFERHQISVGHAARFIVHRDSAIAPIAGESILSNHQ